MPGTARRYLSVGTQWMARTTTRSITMKFPIPIVRRAETAARLSVRNWRPTSLGCPISTRTPARSTTITGWSPATAMGARRSISGNPAAPIETRPNAPAATPSSTGGAGELAQERAAELLAGELGVAVAGLKVVSTTAMTWSDASLGCPQPDMGYAQVVTPGYLGAVPRQRGDGVQSPYQRGRLLRYSV